MINQARSMTAGGSAVSADTVLARFTSVVQSLSSSDWSAAMTVFDLLFIGAFLALVVALGTAAFVAIRGAHQRSFTIVRRTGIASGLYFAALVAVSTVTPRRVVPVNAAQCFDDWCITTVSAVRIRSGSSDSLRVVLQLSSRARGITQGERDVRVYVVDDRNRRYQPVPDTGAIPLSIRLPPQGTATTTRLFVLPTGAGNPALIVAHDVFPHCCIIGDAESFLHRRTVVPLQ
jgi:hypothetical protein